MLKGKQVILVLQEFKVPTCNSGSMGQRRAKGDIGANGAIELTAQASNTGATGKAGSTGQTGSTGVKGNKGDSRAVNATGNTGNTGPTILYYVCC